MPIGICTQCGTATELGDKFCHQCGFTLARRAETPLRPTSPASALFVSSHEPPIPPPTTHDAPRLNRRRRRSKARRIIGTTALVAVVLAATFSAYMVYRIASTLSSMHEVSTPPPHLDAQVLGGTPGTTIDSGPALTAIATYAQGDSSQIVPISTAPAALTPTDAPSAFAGLEVPRSPTQGLAQSADGAPAPPAAIVVPDTVQLFLLMGVDARPGEAIDIGVRPDSLSVAAYDTATNSCRLLSIQRDSRVELPGYGLSKINHALAVGGIPYQKLVVEQFLGVKIDHYALIDFSGMAALINKIGGVDLVITDDPFTIAGYSFSPGPIHLDGKKALAFSRYRYGPDGDFGRIRRQHQVIQAAVDKLASSSAPSMASLVPDTLDSLAAHVRTDLSATELTDLGTDIISHCSRGNAKDETIQGTASTFRDPLLNMDLWYLTVDTADRDRKVRWLVTGSLPPTPAATPAAIVAHPYVRTRLPSP